MKLATSPGGGVHGAPQIVGLAGLLLLGACVSGDPTLPPEEGGGEGFWEKTASLQCREGYVLDWDIVKGWRCVPIRGPPT